jgi:hypothetical protein
MALFKNWPEICRIQDSHVMAALAWVDLESDEAKKLARGFPECFSDSQIQVPVPLSVLREYADSVAMAEEGHPADDMLESYGALKHFNIPSIEFATDPSDLISNPPALLPKDINKDAKVGETVYYRGKLYLVVENNKNPGVKLMHLAPTDCIDEYK